MLTPPAPAGEKIIYQPPEGWYYPSPAQSLSSWQAELASITPQAGLL